MPDNSNESGPKTGKTCKTQRQYFSVPGHPGRPQARRLPCGGYRIDLGRPGPVMANRLPDGRLVLVRD